MWTARLGLSGLIVVATVLAGLSTGWGEPRLNPDGQHYWERQQDRQREERRERLERDRTDDLRRLREHIEDRDHRERMRQLLEERDRR